MTAIAPYRSELATGRDGFAQLLRAEWTKFRTVRGWVIGTLVGALLIVGLGVPDRVEQHVQHPARPERAIDGLPGPADRAGRRMGARQPLLRPSAAGR